MARWEPDSRRRLHEAAFALYAERGFDSTTVAEIASRAGLTERTFFRHFADKREVLFAGSETFQQAMVSAVAGAPGSAAPLDAVAAGLEAAAAQIPGRELARQRQAIIVANPELQERELIKFASLSDALTNTLRDRGLGDPAARLLAEAGLAVFRVAFDRWTDADADADERDLPALIQDSLAELRGIVTEDSRTAAAR
ncbi:MAG TPA: TetR family transcriptional regulator [Solirubrobacteraceae bacterium]|jgi:AcrR family transcriptional regulator